MSKQIPLTQGYVAIVDDEDYEDLKRYRWCMQMSHCGLRARRRIRTSTRLRIVFMSRAILKPKEGMQVDHINHDGLDNRRSNLRLCTHGQNQQNRRKWPGCSSRFKGVSWDKGAKRWRAYIMRDSTQGHLGYFDDEVLAARAYNIAAVEHFGEFALLNEV